VSGLPADVRRPSFARIAALAWKESRTARRRLLVYMSSIALGVAALVAIDSFADNLTTSVREQSRALLGGDVSFQSRARFTPKADSIVDSLARRGFTVARVTSFASMGAITRSQATRLVQVRGVSATWPIYGAVRTTPANVLPRLHAERAVIVDPGLLASLGAEVGDSLSLGYSTFVIAATLDEVPGDPGVVAVIGPRVFVSERWLPATRLLTFGARAEYETLLKVPAGVQPVTWAAAIKPRLDKEKVRVRTAAQSEAGLTEAIDRLGDFLGIAGLVALLLGGIGVASGVHAFLRRKRETIAVLRCIGATSGQVLALYTLQSAVMGLAGATVGAAIGVAIQYTLPTLVRDLIPVDVSVFLSPAAIASGLGVGVWVALAFALRPLVGVRDISPLQVLRTDVDAAARRPWWRDWRGLLVLAAILGSVLALAVVRTGELRTGAAMTAGIGVVLGVLYLVAIAITWLARRALRAGWPYVVRQGVANLYRPANQTRAVVLALGFGSFLVGTLYLAQDVLLRRFSIDAGASAGNVLLFDVQDDQGAPVDSIIRAAGHRVVQRVPIVTMRIADVNGVDAKVAQASAEKAGRQPWPFTREYRSTYRDTIVKSETMVAGKWFDTAPAAPEGFTRISIDQTVARELGVGIGSKVTWNVQGVRVPTVVASLREVNFARFEPNFFVVFEPKAIEDAPKQFAIVARVDGDSAVARLQGQVVARYPNVSSIDISLITRTITSILEKASSAIRFMAVFALAMGIPVLITAVAATRRERLREGVLLKALGATRRQIGRIMVAEYAVLGLLGAAAGMALAMPAAWALARWVFEVPFVVAWVPAAGITLLLLAITIAIGWLTGREVFAEPPMGVLKEG
jgi:putative ABC transport system permease protein